MRGFAAKRGESRLNQTQSSHGSKPPPVWDEADASEQVVHQPWDAAKAQAWRQNQPRQSVWQVLAVQSVLAVTLAALLALVSGHSAWGWSWLYGALSVVLPAAGFAKGLTSRAASQHAFAAVLRFAIWQALKWVMTVLCLVMAPRVVPDLSWPAMLAGLVVTLKVYWLAMFWGRPKSAAASEDFVKE